MNQSGHGASDGPPAGSKPPLASGRCPFHGVPRTPEQACPRCAEEKELAARDGERHARLAKKLAVATIGILGVGLVATGTRGCWQARAIDAALPEARGRVQVHCYGTGGYALVRSGALHGASSDLAPAIAWLREHKIHHVASGAEASEWQRVLQRHPGAERPLCVTGNFILIRDFSPASMERAVDEAARDIAETNLGLVPSVEPHPFLSVPGFVTSALAIGAAAFAFEDLEGARRVAVVVAIVTLVVVPSVIPSIALAVVAQVLLALLGIGLVVLMRGRHSSVA